MEGLLEAPWRVYPAWLLVVAGAWLVVRALRSWARASASLRDPERALLVTRSLRKAIVGATIASAGIGWLTETGWVVLLALIILCEEVLETSTMIAALRNDPAHRGMAGMRGRDRRPREEATHPLS
jgi:hypothetical protein